MTNPMEKAVKEWLDTLPKELMEDLIVSQVFSDKKVLSLSTAILLGIVWIKLTMKEYYFYSALHEVIYKMEQLDRNDYEQKK